MHAEWVLPFRAAGLLRSTPDSPAVDAQGRSSPSLDAVERWGQRSSRVGGLREATVAGWRDPSCGGWAPCRRRGCHGCLTLFIPVFSPPTRLSAVSLQQSLTFSDPECSRDRIQGRRKMSSSFPTSFNKTWQLTWVRVHGSRVTAPARESPPSAVSPLFQRTSTPERMCAEFCDGHGTGGKATPFC